MTPSKLLSFLVIMLIETASMDNILATTIQDGASLDRKGNKDGINLKENSNNLPYVEGEESTNSLQGVGRFLTGASNLVPKTCDKSPKVCLEEGSPGPHCCKKLCVNFETDRSNCGACGKKCKYSELCCKGKCVNIWTDDKHCGGCNKKCNKGERCVYGMCGYA